MQTKKFKIFISLLTMAQLIMAQQKFELKGKAWGINTGFIYLNYESAEGKPVHNSSVIKTNGNFLFTGNICGPTMAYLSYGKVRTIDDANEVNFFLEAGVVTIMLAKNQFKDAKITGSKSQSLYGQLE